MSILVKLQGITRRELLQNVSGMIVTAPALSNINLVAAESAGCVGLSPVSGTSYLDITSSKYQAGTWRMTIPEDIVTERGWAGVYPHKIEWHECADGVMYEGGAVNAFGPGNVQEVEPGVLECVGIRVRKEEPLNWSVRCKSAGDGLQYSVTMHNPHQETMRKASAYISFKVMDPSLWQDDQCFLQTRDGVKNVTQLGRESGSHNGYEAYLLENETYDQPFFRDFFGYNTVRAARPIWAVRLDGAGCTMVAGCQSAYFLTSMVGAVGIAIKFGDLATGARITRSGYMHFSDESIEDAFRKP